MSVLLDGVLYPLSALKDIQGELSIIIDDEELKTGVGRAYRTRAEFDALRDDLRVSHHGLLGDLRPGHAPREPAST